MIGPVRAAYDELVAAQELKADPAQERAVAALDRLAAGFDNGGFLSRLLNSNSKGPAGVSFRGCSIRIRKGLRESTFGAGSDAASRC